MSDQTTDGHVSGDKLLSYLLEQGGLSAEFIKSYPGKFRLVDDPNWLLNWFHGRIEFFMSNEDLESTNSFPEGTDVENPPESEEQLVTTQTRIISVKPHYFRGFRNIEHPINISSSLVVLDGRNSTGKTSLIEAIEWLFTGELTRRKMLLQGDPRELEKCITNEFKPEEEDCSVDLVLKKEDEEEITLRRVLTSDYGTTRTSQPGSKLFLDGNELSAEEELSLNKNLLAGVPPLLMQHSLRSFVLCSPSDRRDYFENLLNLDEITNLIQDAVIGDVQADDIKSKSGSISIGKYRTFIDSHTDPEIREKMNDALDFDNAHRIEGLKEAFIQSAISLFPDLVEEERELSPIESLINAKQQAIRQEALPVLERLQPSKELNESVEKSLEELDISTKLELVEGNNNKVLIAIEAASSITEAKQTVSKAFELLVSEGVIVDLQNDQICPVCSFDEDKTLKKERIDEITSWIPLQKAISSSKEDLSKSIESLVDALTEIYDIRCRLMPIPLDESQWGDDISDAIDDLVEPIKEFRQNHIDCSSHLKSIDVTIKNAISELQNESIDFDNLKEHQDKLSNLAHDIKSLNEVFEKYSEAFTSLDQAVGSSAEDDPSYNLRVSWLELSASIEDISEDVDFEVAKSKARKELELIREYLINSRQIFLESRRSDFSDSMNEIWQKLRDDRYSSFSKLHIPEPRGRGFPVSIEVKALLDDNNKTIEVDALRVFSESQINVLGVAAFVTRSTLLGHRTLVLDDPVQSMDEEHFKTFASRLIPYLLDSGFQVILMTHNDKFARDLSHVFHDYDEYVTMYIRHSRREGCQVDEGNRKVGERLKIAEDKIDEGLLEEACRYIRLAIERFYLITQIKYGPEDFNPTSWNDQAAEYMWMNGVESIINDMQPDYSPRLKEILDLTVPGAHDKSPTGETDIRNAISDIRRLLNELRLGG